MVEGVDKYNNLFASLLLPATAATTGDAARESLSELLVKDGLAKVGGQGQGRGGQGDGLA